MSTLCDIYSAPVRPDAPSDVPDVCDTSVPDGGLHVVDELLATYGRQQEDNAAHARTVLLERDRFAQAAACTVERVVGPTLREFAERLNAHGGGGLVEECLAQGRHGQRLTLWMSLEGPVAVPPRVDRNPYLRLDVDVSWRRVMVWEGDIWHKRGASRRTEPFTLEELTTQNVTERAVGVLRRAVTRGDPSEEVTQ